MNLAALSSVLPHAPPEWVYALQHLSAQWSINSADRLAAFAGQLAHESAEFSRLEERLSYSAERLMAVWPRRFPDLATATPYARNPEKLANRVYGGRMGNGDEASGDGWTYRGRGPIQLTGRTNYDRAGQAIGANLIASPELLLSPSQGLAAAAWFWNINALNDLADREDYETMTRRINGGTLGLAERVNWIRRIRAAIA